MSTFSSNDTQRTVLSDQAYNSLRSAILTGHISLGSQLVVRELSESMDLSPTPIKTALTTLEREGLVVSIPYKGFFVPNYTIKDVLELYSVREAIERKIARLAAMRISRLELHDLENLLEQQLEHAIADTNRVDLQFHRIIAEASDNQRLIDISQGLHDQLQLFFASIAPSSTRFEDSYREHLHIFEALVAKDSDAAEQATWQHSYNATTAFLFQHGQADVTQIDREMLLFDQGFLERVKADNVLKPQVLDSALSETQKSALTAILTEYIGPMAIFVSNNVLSKTVDVGEAIEKMAAKIPDVGKARAFKQAAANFLEDLTP